jgi:hypothetical protein
MAKNRSGEIETLRRRNRKRKEEKVRVVTYPALLSVVIGMFGVLATPRIAQTVPELINYQGELMDSAGNPLNGTVSIMFRIYNQETGGTTLWEETHNSVQIQEGIFSVLLGSLTPFPSTLFDGDSRWFGITVGSDPEMEPRSRIASVAYAVRADRAAESATADYATAAGSAPADNDWDVSGADVYISSGHVGIGTPSPNVALHVYSNTGDTNVTIESDAGEAVLEVDGADPHVNFQRNGTDSGQLGYRTAGDYLYLYKGGYVVVKDGNLGVGEEDPQAKLDVSGEVRLWNRVTAHPSSQGLELTDNDGNTRLRIRDDAVDVVDNSGDTRLKVVNNGNVGIGTESPDSLLHVKKLSGNCNARIETDDGQVDLVLDGASGNQTIEFQENGSVRGSVGYDLANGCLFLEEDGKVVVEDGKLGVGTDSPAETLDVGASMKLGAAGTPFLEIREITGTTSSTGTTTDIPYPAGYTMENTRVLSVGIQGPSTLMGLNMYDITCYHTDTLIIIRYEDHPWMHDRPYRIILMKMK